MVDKLGVDATLRLSELYEQAQSDEIPFPVKVSAYKMFNQTEFSTDEDRVVYNEGITCSQNITYAPLF